MRALNKPAEILTCGIRRAWLDDNRIALIITQGDNSREAADALVQITKETIAELDGGQPLLIMHDLTNVSETFTLYSLKRISDVYDDLPDDQIIYAAVILGGGIVNVVISKLLRRYRNDPIRNERTFTKRSDAHAWLRQARISVQGEMFI